MSRSLSTFSPRDNPYERDRLYKKRLERLADKSSNYPQAAHRVGYDNKYTEDPEETKYIKRCYRSNNGKKGASSYLKNMANRKVRRCKDDIGDYGAYKKIYDYWWNLI